MATRKIYSDIYVKYTMRPRDFAPKATFFIPESDRGSIYPWFENGLCSAQITRAFNKAEITPSKRVRLSLFDSKPNSRHVEVWLCPAECRWGFTSNCSGGIGVDFKRFNLPTQKKRKYYLTLTPLNS